MTGIPERIAVASLFHEILFHRLGRQRKNEEVEKDKKFDGFCGGNNLDRATVTVDEVDNGPGWKTEIPSVGK